MVAQRIRFSLSLVATREATENGFLPRCLWSMTTMAEPNELEAWREVHTKLLIACELAQEAVDAERMQQRYWMEELAANLTLPEGGNADELQLASTSVWARPVAPKKTISKKKMTQLYKKRKGKPESKGKRKASALREKKPKRRDNGDGEEDSSMGAGGPPRKLRIKMKNKKPAASPATPPPAPAPAAREEQYEESEEEEDEDDEVDNDDFDDDEEEEEDLNDTYPHHQQQQHHHHHETSASSHSNHHYPSSSNTAQQYVGQNPLQMMVRMIERDACWARCIFGISCFHGSLQAAVAFGTSQPYSPMTETPSYSAYMSHNPRGSFNSRASGIATYGSLQDIADEDDDEDAF